MMTVKKILGIGGALLLTALGVHCSDPAFMLPDAGNQLLLQVNSDNGLGRVTSDVGGIDCGTVCSVTVDPNTTVTLTAAPVGQAVFAGWGGDCSGTQPTCTLTMDVAKSVTASWKMPALPDMAMPPVPAPSVTSVSPASIVNNVASTLTIMGTNFRTGATVTVGGVTCNQVVVVSPTQITCTYPGKAATCGGQSITVTHPDDQKSGTLAAAMGLTLRSTTVGFANAVNYAAGTGPRMAAVGDVNRV